MSDDTLQVDTGAGNNEQQRAEPRQPREERAERTQRPPRDERDEKDEVVGGGFTFADAARRSGRPNMGGLSDAALTILIDAFEKTKSYDSPSVADAVKRDRYRVVPLDATTTGNVPALLVTLPTQIQDEKFLLVYALLFEQPGPLQFKPQQDRRGDPFDALVLTESHFNSKYQALVKEQVESLQPGSNIVILGQQVILADTVAQLNDKDGVAVINSIYDNALGAIAGFRDNIVDRKLGKRSTQNRINPTWLQGRDRLEATFDYSGNFGTDSSGIPVRSDAAALMYYSSQSAERDEEGNSVRIQLGEARMGLDMFLTEDDSERRGPTLGRRRRNRDNRDQDDTFWQAVLQVNSLTASKQFPYSLELVQLLLSQCALLSNDFRWAGILRPRTAFAGGLKPLVDLGMMNILNPNRDKAGIIEDVTPNIEDEDLGDVIGDMVAEKIAFGLTVPSSGESAWVLSIYEQIALGTDPRDTSFLIKTLFDSADTCFGGYFRDAWEDLTGDRTDSVLPVKSSGTRGFVGYWHDKETNQKRDLREWNVPAVLTAIGKKDPEMARDYQATFDDSNRSLARNLADRYAILQRIVPGMRITGTCEQLVFHADYITALAIAADKAGMSPHISAGDGLNTRRQIGNTLYSDSATSEAGIARRGARRDRDDRSPRGDGRRGDRYY